MFYGLDVHKEFIQVCALGAKGTKRKECRVAASAEAVERLAKELLSTDHVVSRRRSTPGHFTTLSRVTYAEWEQFVPRIRSIDIGSVTENSESPSCNSYRHEPIPNQVNQLPGSGLGARRCGFVVAPIHEHGRETGLIMPTLKVSTDEASDCQP